MYMYLVGTEARLQDPRPASLAPSHDRRDSRFARFTSSYASLTDDGQILRAAAARAGGGGGSRPTYRPLIFVTSIYSTVVPVVER
jgi:hypothetical protein